MGKTIHFVRLFLKKHLGILIIVLIAASIRMFAYPHGYGFDPDATRDAIIALEGARHLYFPLAGAFSSTGPFTFGPWYYWSLIAAAFIFRNPFAPWLLMTASSLVTVVVMYDIGRLVRAKTFGYLLAGFAALAPAEVIVSGALSNLSPVILFSALSLWSCTRILTSTKPSLWWYMALGVFLGLGINAHYQMAGLLILPVLVWYFTYPRSLRTAGIIILGIALTFIPLLIFNLSHNWHTVRGVVEMYHSRDRIYVANSWRIYLGQFWPSLMQFLLGTPLLVSAVLLLVVPALLCIEVVRRSLLRSVAIPAAVVLANVIQLRFYWGERNFVYHYYLEPFILFLIAYVIYRLFTMQRRYGIVLGFIIGLPIFISMVVFDYNRDRSFVTAPDQTQGGIATLRARYANRPIEVFQCDSDVNPVGEATVYLLQFDRMPPSKGRPVRLAVSTGLCKNPIHSGISSYAFVPGTAFVDMSAISVSEFKQASWSAVTTEKVFKKSTQWY